MSDPEWTFTNVLFCLFVLARSHSEAGRSSCLSLPLIRFIQTCLSDRAIDVMGIVVLDARRLVYTQAPCLHFNLSVGLQTFKARRIHVMSRHDSQM